MSDEGDHEIRLLHLRDVIFLLIGLVACGFGIFGLTRPKQGFNEGPGYEFAMWAFVVGGAAFLLYGGYCFLDNRVKLSLTADGLKDHRTGEFIRWDQFRGVRLDIQKTDGFTTSASMYVKVADGEGEREVEFDVAHLERTYDAISKLVHERGVAALRAAATSPEAVLGAMMAEARSDLESGIPISMAANKLIKRGLEPGPVSKLLAMVTGGQVARCSPCRLEFHPSVTTCSVCSGPLSTGGSAS